MPGSRPYTLHETQQHPLARMLPLRRNQMQAYRMGERIPPSALYDHGPVWEAIEWVLNPLDTLQARVNLQRDYTFVSMAATCTSNVNGGFRIILYDLKKRYRFFDRPVNFANFAGPIGPTAGAAFFLREPYRFEIPDSQFLLEVQNFENVLNRVSVALRGVVLRFNAPGLVFPGGPRTGWDWAASVHAAQLPPHHDGEHHE